MRESIELKTLGPLLIINRQVFALASSRLDELAPDNRHR